MIKTYGVRQHMEDSFRSQRLLPWQLLIEMLALLFEPTCLLDGASTFLHGELSLSRGNRVNIQGVSTDKATRKSALNFGGMIFPNSERKKKSIHVPIVKKIHRLECAQYALLKSQFF